MSTGDGAPAVPQLRRQPQRRSLPVARCDGARHEIAIPRLPGIGPGVVLDVRAAERRDVAAPSAGAAFDVVQARERVLPYPELAERGLDLVEPLVDEALFRVVAGGVAGPVVADDRRVAGASRVVAPADRAAPAAERQRPVSRPDDEYGVVLATSGVTADFLADVARRGPEAA